MTWVKLDDTCPDHPSIVGLSDAAFACWVRSLCYASRHLTDGFIPTVALRTVGNAKAAKELEAAGRWVGTEGGWMVHGYTEKQRTRAQVDQKRDLARERQARHRSVTRDTTVAVTRDIGVSHAEVTRPELETDTETENESSVEPDDDTRALCELLAATVEAHQGNRPKVTDRWFRDMDLLRRRGALGWANPAAVEDDRIRRCIEVTFGRLAERNRSGFCWADQVRSPHALREHWDQLRTAAKGNNGSSSITDDDLARMDAEVEAKLRRLGVA